MCVCLCVCVSVCVCLCVCLWPLFLDNHWSDLIETCQVYCWGPEYVRFQGLILIGQVVPKLWPFIYQTNDRTRCYDVTIDLTILLFFFFSFFFWHVRARTSILNQAHAWKSSDTLLTLDGGPHSPFGSADSNMPRLGNTISSNKLLKVYNPILCRIWESDVVNKMIVEIWSAIQKF